MDFITRDEARRNIVEIGLPQIVLDAFDEKPLPYNLDIQFRYPYNILSPDPAGQAAYGQGRITPIWTGGGDYTVVAYHHGTAPQGFFRFNIETADEEQPVGMSWQQILVKEFKFLWEDEVPDHQLKEIARWFEFKYIDLLITELPHSNLDSFEKDASLVSIDPKEARLIAHPFIAVGPDMPQRTRASYAYH